MTRKKSYVTVTDQFCGAGGSTTGAKKAGAEVRLAMNHWQIAIETHNSNHPEVDHDCADISACDPRRYASTDILITSPECTNHSLAKGRKRKNLAQGDMFGAVIDPNEERSRATMWDVPRFAEYHDYRVIVVENVVDARRWAMWDAWLHAMHSLGYQHKCVYVNSMHAHPTPQSRDRMYVVFWKGTKAPDLDFTPRAHCHACGCDVNARQVWINGKTWGVYRGLGSKRGQYVYACPKCHAQVEPYYYAAFNAIDWSLPCPRIGDREKPLKPATLERIQRGLDRFGRVDPALLSMRGEWAVTGTEQPASTVMATCVQQWLLQPFTIETQWTHAGPQRARSITDPLPTQTAQQARGIVMPPFITSQYGSGNNTPITAAAPTIPGADVHELVVPPFVLSGYERVSGRKAATSRMNDPLPTVPGRAVHGVVMPPFIVNMQQNNAATAMHEALQTMLAGGMHKFLTVPAGYPVRVEDCGFRMLEPHECQAAMGFPDDYIVTGNKRQKIKQLGNAVTPPVMEQIIGRCMEVLR